LFSSGTVFFDWVSAWEEEEEEVKCDENCNCRCSDKEAPKLLANVTIEM